MSRFEAVKKMMTTAASYGAPAVMGVAALGGAGYVTANSVYTVDAGHRSIKYNRMNGVGDSTYNEGVHFAFPWLERPIIFDVRARPYTVTSLTGSRDLQMVNISLRSLCKPDTSRLPELYRSIGKDYDEKVMPSVANEVLKSVIAQYNASELIQQRELVSRMIRQRLVQRASDFCILLDDVAITHLSFSPEYEKAVESKQVAQQQAEKARYLVLHAQEEKKRTIIHAEGERQSAEMIGDAIAANPGFVELRRINTAKEISALLARSSNRMVLSTDALMLNTAGGKSAEETAGNLDRKLGTENSKKGWFGGK